MALPATDSLISGSTESITTYSANWSLAQGAYNTTTNGGVGNSAGGSAAFWNADTFPNDQFSQATLHTTGGAGTNGVTVRANATSGGNYYWFRVAVAGGPGVYNVGEFVNGVGTSLSGGNIGHAFSIGDVILLAVIGNKLTAYQNGVLLFTATDSSLTSGSAGVAATTTVGPALTSWRGGSLVAAPLPFNQTQFFVQDRVIVS